MADRITLQVTRYLPEDSNRPTSQDYEIPLRKDWSILDGLNHIKDHVDGTLSYRWSCRMGICGSCGMTVDGEPKLACATFLADYAPGPVRVEPLNNFPVVRDLVVEIGDFLEKLSAVKPWIIRDDDEPVEGEYLQTPAELRRTSNSACASTACCATRPARSTVSSRASSGRRPSPWRSVTTWIPVMRAATNDWTSCRPIMGSGTALSWASARGPAPRT